MFGCLESLELTLGNGVEMRGVCVVHDLGDVWRFVVSNANRPVDCVEEDMLLDLLGTVGPDSLGGVAAEADD